MNDYDKYSEEELTELVGKQKDISHCAFKILYSRYSTELYSFCIGMMHNSEEADDIFQETMVRFYKVLAGNNFENRNIKHYLFTIARNLFYNARRDNKKNVTFDPMKHETVFTQNTDFDLSGIIEGAVKKLDHKYREVFILKEYHGLSIDEIAEICGLSYQGARSRIRRAKLLLSSILQPYLKEYSDEK